MPEGSFKAWSMNGGFRIVLTTSTFPVPGQRGHARFILDLAQSLTEYAHVAVLAPHASGIGTKETIGSVEVHRFRYFFPSSLERLAYGSGMRHNMRKSLLSLIQVPLLVAAQLLATIRLVFTFKPDVINAHWLVPQGVTSAIVSRFLNVSLVLHVHAADVYFLQRLRIGPLVARFVVRNSARVLADGSHVRDALDVLLGFQSNALIRPMGVSVQSFTKRMARPFGVPESYVVFVGRLVEKKGVEYLIRALPIVRRQVPELAAVLVGGGPLEEDLRRISREERIDDSVVFLGPRSHAEAMAIVQNAAVACVPSVIDARGETDGMPTVVIEALAAGVPVVGTKVDGIPDVLVDRSNGWLARPADPEDLARALVEATTSDTSDVVRQGIRTAGDHDWRRVGEFYIEVLKQQSRTR
jgi:glycosyltransferase involved in cell wall biosynthesis